MFCIFLNSLLLLSLFFQKYDCCVLECFRITGCQRYVTAGAVLLVIAVLCAWDTRHCKAATHDDLLKSCLFVLEGSNYQCNQ